jgi:hypothetical protein
MTKPQIGQRYVHKQTSKVIHIKAIKHDFIQPSMGKFYISIKELLSDWEHKKLPKKRPPASIRITKYEEAAARKIYGSLSACFRAGLKAGGYHG